MRSWERSWRRRAEQTQRGRRAAPCTESGSLHLHLPPTQTDLALSLVETPTASANQGPEDGAAALGVRALLGAPLVAEQAGSRVSK